MSVKRMKPADYADLVECVVSAALASELERQAIWISHCVKIFGCVSMCVWLDYYETPTLIRSLRVLLLPPRMPAMSRNKVCSSIKRRVLRGAARVTSGEGVCMKLNHPDTRVFVPLSMKPNKKGDKSCVS